MFSPTTFDIYIWPTDQLDERIHINLKLKKETWILMRAVERWLPKYDQHIVEDILESTSTK
jgi:hypothetical protein